MIRERPIRGESHLDFLGESEGSLPPPHDSFPDAGEAINDFWSMSGIFTYRHHVEPKVKLYSPREESFPIPLKTSDVSRTTHTNLDVKQEKRIDDYWNIVGIQFRPSWFLENARKLRGIYFIDPEDKEFKEIIENARKKLETSVAPAMPCKIKKNCGSGASDKIKTRLACTLEASESLRLRMGESLPNHHEDLFAGRGNNSLQHKHLVHNFIPVPQAMKIPAAKAAVDKEWETLEKFSAWNLTEVRSKKQVIDEARASGATVHFASLMDICHLKNDELEAKHQKYKG